MNPEEEASNAAESRGDRIDQASADFINESVSDLEPSRATDTIKIDAALDGQSAYGRNLWALLSLELWHRQFID